MGITGSMKIVFARSLYTEWKPYPHNRDPHRRLKNRLRLALLL